MHRQSHNSHTSITNDFFAHGIQGIETHRVNERRREARNQIHSQQITPVRRWLGTMMIAVGTGIAGKNLSIPGERIAHKHPSVSDGLAVTR